MTYPILSIRDASITFGAKPLFENLDLNVYDKDRICLVGRNGEGKSTLLKIITGDYELDKGDRWLKPGTTVGYLAQQFTFADDHKVIDYVMEGLSPSEQTDDRKYLADIVLTPLQLNGNDLLNKLSGGQLRRAGLAKALIEQPDLLLLDEPTNHLDIHTIEWLEDYLNQYNGAIICISHDRAFLRNISNKTFWLDRGNLRVNNKGYSEFENWSFEILEQEQRELDKLARKLSDEEVWRNQGVTARRKRNQRRLAELYRLRDKLATDQAVANKLKTKLRLDPLAPALSSKLVIELDQICKSYEEKIIIDNLSMRIMRGDKIGIVGNNGTGKTSFLRICIGDEEPDSGRVKIGKTVTVTYFDQKRVYLDPEDTLWDTLCPGGSDHVKVGERMIHVVSYLKNFFFEAKQARDKVATLSGGQANRLLLAKALADPGSLLILDEPTNDLDMDTLDMIQEVLSDYSGTLVIVSHDRDFLDRLVTKTLVFNGNGVIEEYIGGYSDYIKETKPRITPKAKKKAESTIPVENEKPKKLSYNLTRELENLPKLITQLEDEISSLEQELFDPALYQNSPELFAEKSLRLTNAKSELENAWNRWQEIEELAQNT
jgi:ATP-binding cassette subfamily F protein uup